MPFWNKEEIDQLKSEIRLLKGKIEALAIELKEIIDQIEHRDRRLIDGLMENQHYLNGTIDKLGAQVEKNRYLIERTIAVAEENQVQIGQIKNNQISILSEGINNSIHDQSVNNIDLSPHTKQTLAEAAQEIQDLLDQLSKTYPTTTTVEKANVATKAMEEIEKKPKIKNKIIKALKAGGTATLLELTNNPIVKILTPMLESLLENDQ
ncbi:MAG: hypothetical protein QNJ63_13540 [Calothrix sp. MO_192.B10]|nr:hypothetical protein [Calothrix sp. MO_192.B10]